MGSIPSDWKHLLRTETSQKSLLKIFCYKNKYTRTIKDFKKFSNKEIYLTLQSNSTKYNNLSNSFHDQTSLRNTIFSVVTFGVKRLLIALREKCPNMELLLVRIFSLDTGKYGPEVIPYWDTFHAVSV